ncbi:NADPH-dependent oxidoreductase [Paenibacillus albidus]|uniref:NADPH-dependent oxidoreductase n=1 Tax=Paenibacillus albidus TaxID=2041023 RepID=UPI001BECA872|nr:NADPH-dependent oxidoreductase [Paenibacillus albidus]MBT2293112.1 NADPH-dependent oxidoreductase [Paenibacillus albidus]
MNEVIRTLHNHRSFRDYKDTPVSAENLREIIAAAQAAPSWAHGQHVTIISVQDKPHREQLAVLSGNQRHVAEAPVFLVFCMDFYRAQLASEMEGQPFETPQDVDALLVGATDVGLALAGAITAAESLGLGTIPIGGIRRQTKEVITLLQLPLYVFPVAGLCIGYPAADVPQKPRLPVQAVYHEEQYQPELTGLLREYNQIHREFLQAQGGTVRDWTSTLAHFYAANPRYGDAKAGLEQQGFLGDEREKEK